MKCSKCGTETIDNVKFCPQCGEKMLVTVHGKFDSVNNESKSTDVGKSIADRCREYIRKWWAKLRLFEKVCVIMIVIYAFLFLWGISVEKMICSVISVIAMLLVITGWLMNREIIRCSKKLWSIIALVVATFLIVPYALCGSYSTVKIEGGEEDFLGKNYLTVMLELEDFGFKNVVLKEIDDLDSSKNDRCGIVTRLSIDGKQDFEDGMEYDSNVEVIIEFHSAIKKNMPFSYDEINQYDSKELETKLLEAGFTDVTVKEVYDLDPDLYDEESQIEVDVYGGWNYQKNEKIAFDTPIVITCHHTYEKYSVKFHIDFKENLIFSKYDVELLIDGTTKYTLQHGQDGDFEFSLAEGQHTFAFVNMESSAVKGEINIVVDCDINATLGISCYYDHVSVETEYIDRLEELAADEAKVMCDATELKNQNYSTVIALLKSYGFTNITEKPVYDIYWGITETGSVESVYIGSNGAFKRGDVFKRNASIVVTYHMPEDENPANIKMTTNDESLKGLNVDVVKQKLGEMGFKNFEYEIYETDVLNKDRTINTVKIKSDGIVDSDFAVGDVFKPDASVVLGYYIYVEPEKNLTVDNCSELEMLIKLDGQKDIKKIIDFVSSYKGKTIEIEMLTAFVQNHGSYKTRFDYLLYAVSGEYVMMSGPAFMFEDVNYNDLKLTGDNIPDTFSINLHCYVIAEIEGIKDGMILLDPISIKVLSDLNLQ